MLYGANLRTRTVRIEDWLAKTHILRLADDLDEWAIGSLLSETVRVEVAVSDMEHGGSAQLVVTAIERVEPPETSDYYTWDFEAAVERAKPIESIHDLAIPGIDEDEADAFWRAVND